MQLAEGLRAFLYDSSYYDLAGQVGRQGPDGDWAVIIIRNEQIAREAISDRELDRAPRGRAQVLQDREQRGVFAPIQVEVETREAVHRGETGP